MTTDPSCLEIEALDPRIDSVQPGGGVIVKLELAWGRARRWLLKRFFPKYIERMRATRKGTENVCPHEVLDPRDVKYYRILGGYYWDKQDDPFVWRDRLPFARAGLAELLVFGGGSLALAALLTWIYWPAAVVPAALGVFVISFFRNPTRTAPCNADVLVSPADGKVVAIEEIEHDDYIDGPAVEIGIFLSVFNVHINRVPSATRVIGMSYEPGKYLNALLPESARENERLIVRLQETGPERRRLIVRQIAGAIARRIVCWVRPGEELDRGEQFGMIKFGSRTELVVPREPGMTIDVKIGDNIHAGTSILVRY